MPADQTSPVYHAGDKMVDVLFASNRAAQTNKLRTRKDGPIESILGYQSTDPRMFKICSDLSKLTDILPTTLDDLGRTSGNGVPGNFYGVRHVPGYPMIRGTYPLTDNELKREREGLANSWVEPWHRELFRCFVQVFFEDLVAVPLRLRKGSSSVNPIFTREPKEKMAIALEAIADAKTAGELWVKGDFKNAYLNYHVGGCYYVVYRNQSTDKISFENGKWVAKPRMVADMDYAITGGRSGYQLESSKALDDVDFQVPEGFFRCRLRTAMGLSYKTSVAQMPVFQAVRRKLYTEYGWSYHHTTRMQKEEKLRAWGHQIYVDVSDHDINWPKKLYAPEVEDVLLGMGWSEWGVALIIKSLDLPVYISSPAEGEGHVLFGSWIKPQVNVGLPSGNPGTDIWGTLGMSFCYCLTQIVETAMMYKSVIERGQGLRFVRDYLKGALDFGCMSKSDDAVMVWKTAELIRRAKLLHAKMRDKPDVLVCPYMKFSYELGGKFLGDLAIYPSSGDPAGVIMTGDIRSDIYNTFVPEYGVDSAEPDRTKARRSYPGLAWGSRDAVYGSHPSYGVVTEHVERTFRNATGESYQAYRANWEKRDKALLSEYLRRKQRELHIEDLSLEDVLVLSDSTKLQYKFDAIDIHPDVVAVSEFQISMDVTRPYLQQFTNQAYVA